jgi:DNA polymerase I-like protein with 3'-5' exonuclease and polymerase domains
VINGESKYIKGKVERALRQSVNSPIQGSAVDMASLSLIKMSEDLMRYEIDAAPILHIHDELVVYSHKDCVDAVCKVMDDAMTKYLVELTNFRVPLTVDTEICQRWSDKHLHGD